MSVCRFSTVLLAVYPAILSPHSLSPLSFKQKQKI